MNNLNASNYNYSGVYRSVKFEDILSKITLCYEDMLISTCSLNNNENDIRDYLFLNYLNKEDKKQQFQLSDYMFDKEVEEYNGYGRVDIRILPINPFENERAYFIIECKRLDNVNTSGTTGLNAMYIENGMNRFIELNRYSSYYNINAMIGFVVEPLDIHANIGKINALSKSLLTGSSAQDIQKENFIPHFPYHYSSCHTKEDGSNIKLYHLMYDVSSKIM